MILGSVQLGSLQAQLGAGAFAISAPAATVPDGPTYDATYQATATYAATYQATKTYDATDQRTKTYESEWD